MCEIYLNEILYKYQNSKTEKQKDKIFNKFIKQIWNSKCKYEIIIKKYGFRINDSLLNNKYLSNFFNKYNNLEYKVCKSQFSKRDLNSIDYIKIHINNTYSYLFDKEVYYDKEYYKLLYTPKQQYFNIIKNKINIKDIDIKSLTDEIINNLIKSDRIKKKSVNKKIDLSWTEYQKLVNIYLRKCFDNYKSIEEYEDENDWETRIFVDCWNEDNYIISYFNKSLTGYFRDYIKEITNFKDKYKWKRSLNKYLKVKNVTNEYTPLQLCIGRYYKTKKELLNVSDDNILKLTKRQRKLIKQIEEIINKYDEKDIILFNDYGTPYISQAFITNYINDKYKWNVITIAEVIYERINSKDNFCINCGKKIIKKSNKTKYCSSCAKEIKKKQNLEIWHKNKDKYKN